MKKNKQRIRCIATASLEEPDRMIATTAALSHRQRTVLPFHKCPQMAQATTTGSSSLTVMWMWSQAGGHWNWNHAPAERKLHSHSDLKHRKSRWLKAVTAQQYRSLKLHSSLARRLPTSVDQTGNLYCAAPSGSALS